MNRAECPTIHAHHEPTMWLRREVEAIFEAFTSGRPDSVGICAHLAANPDQTWVTALHLPRVATCEPCSLVIHRLEGHEDYRCDRCGQVDPAIVAFVTQVRTFIIMFGLCPDCHALEVGK